MGYSVRNGGTPGVLCRDGFRAAILVGLFVWGGPAVAQPKELLSIKADKDAVRCVAFSPDGKTLAAATDRARDKVVKLWDVTMGQERAPLRGHTDLIHSLAYSPDGTMLATASMDKTVKLWDATSGKELATLLGHTSAVKCVAFSPNSKMLASGSWDSTAKVWDLSSMNGPGK